MKLKIEIDLTKVADFQAHSVVCEALQELRDLLIMQGEIPAELAIFNDHHGRVGKMEVERL